MTWPVGSITGEEDVMSSRRGTGHGPNRGAGAGSGAGHSSYEEVAVGRRSSSEYRQGFDEARRAYLIGQAVRERRLALGLSQTEVAARAGMTQPALSRLEGGGTVPTIPVLERIAAALDAQLVVTLAPPAA